ncbi:unnamed protein product [Echinostoma caproni]|uniref:TLDc domain-containing protein n=1 Tax=Echinostoma caproni TaxID=27848 RepID=A0A183AQX3_9TREM|nr:unnamed protein product [Echinostoma caproni]
MKLLHFRLFNQQVFGRSPSSPASKEIILHRFGHVTNSTKRINQSLIVTEAKAFALFLRWTAELVIYAKPNPGQFYSTSVSALIDKLFKVLLESLGADGSVGRLSRAYCSEINVIKTGLVPSIVRLCAWLSHIYTQNDTLETPFDIPTTHQFHLPPTEDEHANAQPYYDLELAGQGLLEYFTLILETLGLHSMQASDLNALLSLFRYEPVRHQSSNILKTCGPEQLTPGQWHALAISFSTSRRLIVTRPRLTVYVDALKVQSCELRLPQVDGDAYIMHIGGCPTWVEQICYMKLLMSLQPKTQKKYTPVVAPWSLSQKIGQKPSYSDMNGSNVGNVAPVTSRDIGVVRKCQLGEEKYNWGTLASFRGPCDLTYMLDNESYCSTGKLAFYYHAKAFNPIHSVCSDLMAETIGAPILLATLKRSCEAVAYSGENKLCHEREIQSDEWVKHYAQKVEFYSGLPASVTGARCFRTVKFIDSINQIGGLAALFPILRLIQEFPRGTSRLDDIESSNETNADSGMTDVGKPEESQDLYRPTLGRSELLQQEVAGRKLQKLIHLVHPLRLDAAVVAACQELVELTSQHRQRSPSTMESTFEMLMGSGPDTPVETMVTYRTFFLKHIFLNWDLWSRANAIAQLEHVQRVICLAQYKPRTFRIVMNIRTLLEVLETYYG